MESFILFDGWVIFQCVCVYVVKVKMLISQSCPTLCDPMNYSLLGSSVHEILQARIPEWVSMPSSRESSWPRDQTCVSCISCIGKRILYHCTTWKTLDNKWIRRSTITLFIKLSKPHIKNFETSRKVLCFLTFGGICLLNIHADSLAWNTGNCGKQVFNPLLPGPLNRTSLHLQGSVPPKHSSAIIYHKLLS